MLRRNLLDAQEAFIRGEEGRLVNLQFRIVLGRILGVSHGFRTRRIESFQPHHS
jgi:hypothetical protein